MAESTASRLDRSARESRERSAVDIPPGDEDEQEPGPSNANYSYEVEDAEPDSLLCSEDAAGNIADPDESERKDDADSGISSMNSTAAATGASVNPDWVSSTRSGASAVVGAAALEHEEPTNFVAACYSRMTLNDPDVVGPGLERHSLGNLAWRSHQLSMPQDDYLRDEWQLQKIVGQDSPENNPNRPPRMRTPRDPQRRNMAAFSNPPLHHRSSSPPNYNAPAAHNDPVGLYNWQATKMTVKERLGFLFNSNILSDVTFVVGREAQQQSIPAHRFVLSVGSAVFDAMFNSTLATKDEEIELPDVEPASFLALLRFLYSDEVQIGPETVMTTLYTAKKYAVPALEKHCVDFLKHHLCADNAFMLLTQARLFDESQLTNMCLDTIDKATPEALGAEGFIDIDINTLSAVLERDSLRIKEANLFSAVIRWSEAECLRQGLPVNPENKRSVLGRVLTQIRFPLMTVEEFAQGPAQSGILTDRECVSLFLHFTVNPKPPVGFLDVPRCSMTGKEQTVSRFQQIESRWGYSGTSDKIRFMVDRRIFVVGFGLYGSIHGPSEYQVTIQITHTGSARALGANRTSFSSDGTNATFRVMFKEPIEILPNTNYTASATLKGLDSHYGTKGLRKLGVDFPTGGKVTFQFSYAAGNNNGTSVEDGQIPEIIFYM